MGVLEVVREAVEKRKMLFLLLGEIEAQLATARAEGRSADVALKLQQSRSQVLDLLERLSGELGGADPAEAVRIAEEVKHLMEVAGRLQSIRAT